MKFLDSPGAENVTDKFDSVILYGFLANLLFIFFKIFKMGRENHDGRIKKSHTYAVVCADILISLGCFIQFVMVVIYRFSHTGMVCSGDYAAEELIIQGKSSDASSLLKDDKYSAYYMGEEGDFLFYLVFTFVIALFVLLLLSCCIGSCLFLAGSFTAVKLIEDILKNIEMLPEMMKKSSGGQQEDSDF